MKNILIGLTLMLLGSGCAIKHPGLHNCGFAYKTLVLAKDTKCRDPKQVEKYIDDFVDRVNRNTVRTFPNGQRFPVIGYDDVPSMVVYTHGPPMRTGARYKFRTILGFYRADLDAAYVWRGWGDRFSLAHEFGHGVLHKTNWVPNGDMCHESIMWAYFDPTYKRGHGAYWNCK